MIEPKVKGNFFDRVYICIKKSMGAAGVEKIGMSPDGFDLERWYPYADFCEYLRKASISFEDNPVAQPQKLGYNAMFKDERWKTMFKGQSPKDVFGTNKRQDALFMVGRFLIEKVEDDMVQVRMTLWSTNGEDNKLWAEYYTGVMEGVLALTGTEGTVETMEGEEDTKKFWTYIVRW